MRKKTIVFFYIPGLILTIAGIVVLIIASASAASTVAAATSASGATQASINAAATSAAAATATQFLLSGLIIAVGGILLFVSWLGALIATGRQGRWGWFCVVLLLSWLFTIGELVYLIAGPGFGSFPAPGLQG